MMMNRIKGKGQEGTGQSLNQLQALRITLSVCILRSVSLALHAHAISPVSEGTLMVTPGGSGLLPVPRGTKGLRTCNCSALRLYGAVAV
jgi:hypothetical protein